MSFIKWWDSINIYDIKYFMYVCMYVRARAPVCVKIKIRLHYQSKNLINCNIIKL